MGSEPHALAPECIEHASQTRYNACRIYGRIIAHGQTYIYDVTRDVLVRQDLWAAYKQLRKQGVFDDQPPAKPD